MLGVFSLTYTAACRNVKEASGASEGGPGIAKLTAFWGELPTTEQCLVSLPIKARSMFTLEDEESITAHYL